MQNTILFSYNQCVIYNWTMFFYSTNSIYMWFEHFYALNYTQMCCTIELRPTIIVRIPYLCSGYKYISDTFNFNEKIFFVMNFEWNRSLQREYDTKFICCTRQQSKNELHNYFHWENVFFMQIFNKKKKHLLVCLS